MSKFTLPCSCVICHQHFTAQSIASHHKAKHTPKPYRGDCVVCGKEVSKNSTKYCSRSCGAIASNAIKDRTKFKPGPPKIIGTRRRDSQYIKKVKPPFTKVNQCPVCGKWHTKSNTCSVACKSVLLSNAMKERISKGYNPNANRGRSKQSYLERSFGEWLDANLPNVQYIQEHPFRRRDITKTYFADFYFPSIALIIELDGTQHKYTTEYDAERDRIILDQYGVRVIRITHAEYMSKTRVKEIWSLLGESNPGYHVGSVES
jgi:very-short-patch-repair endonuclease